MAESDSPEDIGRLKQAIDSNDLDRVTALMTRTPPSCESSMLNLLSLPGRTLPAVAALALLAGCSGPPSPSAAESDAAVRNAADSTINIFHQALRTNDTTAFLAPLADDFTVMPPGEAPVRGKDAVRAWYLGLLTQYRTSSLSLTDGELFVADGWATHLGRYEWGLTPVAGGAAVVERGHYMQVWKQQPEGQWRIVREIWNSSIPLSAAGQ